MEQPVEPPPTDELLLQVGSELAHHSGLAQGIEHLSFADLGAAARVPPSTLRRAYADRAALACDTGLALADRIRGGTTGPTVDTIVTALHSDEPGPVFPPEVFVAGIDAVGEMGMDEWITALRFSHLEPVQARLSARQRLTLRQTGDLVRVTAAAQGIAVEPSVASGIGLLLHTIGRGLAMRRVIDPAVQLEAIAEVVAPLLGGGLRLTGLPSADVVTEPVPPTTIRQATAAVAADVCRTSGTAAPFDHVLLSDVANAAHVAPTALYHWWPSIEHYRQALFDRLIDERLDAIPHSPATSESLARALVDVHGPVSEHRLVWRLVLGCLSDRRAELNDARLRWHRERERRIGQAIDHVAATRGRPRVDQRRAEPVVAALTCFLDGVGTLAELEARWDEPSLIDESVAVVIRLLDELLGVG